MARFATWIAAVVAVVGMTVASAKTLVAYYSWSPDGNTRFVAQVIAEATGADLLELKLEKDYSTDYDVCVKQAKADWLSKARPALAVKCENIAEYDTIFVGSPNWWGTIAPPLLTFLCSYDFTGKKVIPFFTHGGGGMQKCEEDVKKAIPKANLVFAKTWWGTFVKMKKEEIIAWAKSVK
ncbi:MAG: NAD(P)H-dependent oxidoreductase [Victivallales bacterium]|nr:NAD(P)H-dependent oxidoreductase [Victivallales bacterium]